MIFLRYYSCVPPLVCFNFFCVCVHLAIKLAVKLGVKFGREIGASRAAGVKCCFIYCFHEGVEVIGFTPGQPTCSRLKILGVLEGVHAIIENSLQMITRRNFKK